MAKKKVISQLEALEADIDLRLHSLVMDASGTFSEDDFQLVIVYLRAAFAAGYTQALAEKKRGLLMREHGYRIPEIGEIHG